jgi:hypothetical protein
MKFLFGLFCGVLASFLFFHCAVKQGDAEAADASAPLYLALDQPDSCEPEEIRDADNPDARLSHCEDQDWNGSTRLKDWLTELNANPREYELICSGVAQEVHDSLPEPQPAKPNKVPAQPENVARNHQE